MTKRKKTIWIVVPLVVVLVVGALLGGLIPYAIKINYEKDKEKLKEVLAGKTMSVFGDSISTYNGWSNNNQTGNSTTGGYAYTYFDNDALKDVNETYWKQTADAVGIDILVNNSKSGDFLSDEGLGPERISQLHCDVGENAGKTPDIIVIYFGVNDYLRQIPRNIFGEKYNMMVKKAKQTYPDAEIFCMNLPTLGNHENAVSLKSYNNEIKKVAKENDCHLVNLFKDSGITKSNLDTCMFDGWLHPNKKGMDLISKCLIKSFTKAFL